VNGKGVATENEIDPCSGLPCPGKFLYDTSRDDRLKDMQGRLVVDWGKGYLAWHQRANKNDKRVIELLRDPEDEPFPGYFAFRCRLSELADLPLTWKTQLRDAKGVYVLTSATARAHYVGSATGQDGFFGRWTQHAKAGGDAVGFKTLGPSEYQVSILQVSAGFDTDEDILRTEHAWMEKLQSRSMGINGNPPAAAARQREPQPIPSVTVL
jgi:GIY-YIG catalytic domain